MAYYYLPRTIVISILGFNQFADKDSENADLRAQLEALRKQIGTM